MRGISFHLLLLYVRPCVHALSLSTAVVVNRNRILSILKLEDDHVNQANR